MRVNPETNYLERKSKGSASRGINHKARWRDWWLVKSSKGTCGAISSTQTITLPEKFVGKRVRFKIELVEE